MSCAARAATQLLPETSTQIVPGRGHGWTRVLARLRSGVQRRANGRQDRDPAETDPRTASALNRIAFARPVAEGFVSVEMPYRRGYPRPPDREDRLPCYGPFPSTVVSLDEIIAEKLRALCRLPRATDLADIATVLRREEHDSAHVRELTTEKFKLVKDGDHHERITRRVEQMRTEYQADVQAIAPDAPNYEAAASILARSLNDLLP